MRAPPVPAALRSRSFRADRIAWVVFLALVVSASAATRAWLHRRVRGEGASTPLTLEYRLPVLAYERVADAADHLSPGRLAEHLEALRAAGFQPVSLRQVRDAYRGGAPLPERPILITFDGGHLSTYQAADPLLRRLSWPAVMFVEPRLQEERHATYVYWDRLRRMVDSGVWDVGTVGPWPDAARVVERQLGASYQVLAAARRAGGDAETRDGAGPAVGFENAWFGVNGPDADPARLLRFRVPPGWSGGELVDRLRLALAAPELRPSGEPPRVESARWACSIGRLDAEGEVVTLTGAARAEAWLAGSEWARDFVLEAEVRPERGPFWVIQQAVASRDAWRWGGAEQALSLQRVQPGPRIDVIARTDVGSRPGTWHRLRVVKRGAGVWVEWDGAPVPDLPHGVAARWRGYVGFSTGNPREPGRVSVRRVRFAAIPYAVREVSASPSEQEIHALLADAPLLAGVSPPGLVQEGARLARRPVDAQLLAMLAARGAWDVVPTVELDGDTASARTSRAAEIAELAARQGWAGVRVVVRDPVPAAAWRDAAPAWRRLFERRGLRLVLQPRPGSQR